MDEGKLITALAELREILEDPQPEQASWHEERNKVGRHLLKMLEERFKHPLHYTPKKSE